jgi:asparagine synthetase A
MKLDFNNGVVQFNENGEYETDIVTSLPHRLTVVDGEVVDKYPGKTDREVKIADHVTAAALVKAEQKLWDDAKEDERYGNRPADLPELDLPEEE